MANQCVFEMKVTGHEESIIEFEKRLQGVSESGKRYYGIDFAEDFGFTNESNGLVSLIISGSCDWSVEARMLKTGYKHEEFKKNHPEVSTLEDDTKELNLAIEVYSEEPGNCFQEHYVVAFGDVEVNEVLDYAEINKEEYLNNPDSYLDVINEFGMDHEDVMEFIKKEKEEEWIPLGKLDKCYRDFATQMEHEPLSETVLSAQARCEKQFVDSVNKEQNMQKVY